MTRGGLLIAVALVAALLPAVPAEAATTAPAPTPVVAGKALIDSRTGATFVPHGANWPSFEYACTAVSGKGWGYNNGGATAAAATAMAAWHINAVRIPLNQDCWLGANPSHDYGTVSGYRAALRTWVDILNAHGIVAILDLHWNAPAGKVAVDQYAMADAQSVTFWSQVAHDYAGSPSVMFDAFNEPYSRGAFQLSWDCWKNGGCQAPDVDQRSSLDGGTYPVAGMSALVSAIRTAGAHQPVMLGGLDYSNDLRGWLANRPSDTQLVASWHNYPGQRCHTVTCWDAEIAPVAAVVPVVAGEFGQTDGDAGYLTSFMDWADSHGVGYTAWAWWQVATTEDLQNGRYALIADDGSFAPKAPSGTALHDHLAALSTPTPPPPPPVTTRGLGLTGFESGTSGWSKLAGPISFSSHKSSSGSHGGTHYGSIKGASASRAIGRDIKTPVRPGDVFTTTVWVKSSSSSAATASVMLSAIGGAPESVTVTKNAVNKWIPITVAVHVVHGNHTAIRIRITIVTKNRTLYLDDVSLSVTR
jgi:hypothetical protein